MFINFLLFSATTPLINIFFIQKVSTFMYSIVNWISIIIAVAMSKILNDKKNRDFLELFFLQIIIVDSIFFVIISFVGQYYINVRFFGLALLNGTTTPMWICIINSNINRVFMGDELTAFRTKQDYITSISQFIGASLAIILTKLYINIDILMLIQIIASVTMGYFDYKTVKLIKAIDSTVIYK